MRRYRVLVIGGGLASARTIKSYRAAGGDGRVALISRDDTLPYHRPPLSKRYLRGEAETHDTLVEREDFYARNEVDVMLERSARRVHPREQKVEIDGGRRYRYEQLVIASGATPRRLRVRGAELAGIFTLRTLADATAIREAAASATSALVVGGGFIGMEVAASLRQLGLRVRLIHLGRGLFDQLRSPKLSDELLALYRRQQVEVLLGEEVAGFGGDGRLEYAETKSGLRVEADMAVVGVGVVPNVDFLADSGLALDDGVVVNQHFETNAPGVYAVGDVASFFDPLYGRRRRIEHWSNASYQGTEVGKIVAGEPGGYEAVSSFFSEVFGTTIKVFGDVSRAGQLHEEGSLETGFLATYGDAGRLVGATSVAQSRELEALVMDLIKQGAPADALERDLVAGRLW